MVVVGGGFAGLSAAVAASVNGSNAVLLERCAEPGGNVTQAYVHTICGLFELNTGTPSYLHGGFPEAFSRQLVDDGLASTPESVGNVFVQPIYPETMGNYLTNKLGMVEGLTFRPNRSVTSVTPSGEDVVVSGQNTDSNESFSIRTNTVIDASGDAVTAPESPEVDVDSVQIPSLIFLVEGMDEELTSGYGKLRLNRDIAGGVKEGELPEGCESILVRPGRNPRQAYVTLNLPREMVGSYNPFDETILEDFESEARRRASLIVGFLRKQRDSLSDLSISHFPPRIGIRETRRLETRYTLTEEDVLSGRSFEGAVAQSSWPVEFWSDYSAAELQYPETEMDVPLDALISKNDARVGTAGRCMGGTQRAVAALRVLGTALATGQAIGVAAALAADNQSPLSDVTSREVRRRIKQTDWGRVFDNRV